MRLLLDENVPLRFVFDFGEHDAEHVRRLGWLAMPDRQIAERAADQFDAILTLDQTFPQELAGLDKYPAIIVLSPSRRR
jgi:predicted nuclease of predicted toxin-antitoxin system